MHCNRKTKSTNNEHRVSDKKTSDNNYAVGGAAKERLGMAKESRKEATKVRGK